MNAQEIIAELPNLGPEEILLVKSKVDELAETKRRPNPGEAGAPTAQKKEHVAAFLLRVAGTAEGLPPDLAENHDHYLYGTPKRVGK